MKKFKFSSLRKKRVIPYIAQISWGIRLSHLKGPGHRFLTFFGQFRIFFEIFPFRKKVDFGHHEFIKPRLFTSNRAQFASKAQITRRTRFWHFQRTNGFLWSKEMDLSTKNRFSDSWENAHLALKFMYLGAAATCLAHILQFDSTHEYSFEKNGFANRKFVSDLREIEKKSFLKSRRRSSKHSKVTYFVP